MWSASNHPELIRPGARDPAPARGSCPSCRRRPPAPRTRWRAVDEEAYRSNLVGDVPPGNTVRCLRNAVVDRAEHAPGGRDVQRLVVRGEAGPRRWLDGEHRDVGVLDDLALVEGGRGWVDRCVRSCRREVVEVARVPLLDGCGRGVERDVRRRREVAHTPRRVVGEVPILVARPQRVVRHCTESVVGDVTPLCNRGRPERGGDDQRQDDEEDVERAAQKPQLVPPTTTLFRRNCRRTVASGATMTPQSSA